MCRTLIIDEILNTKYLMPDDMPILMDYNDNEKIEVELPIELTKEVEKKPTPKCGCCNKENDLNNMVKCEGCNNFTLCKYCYEEREDEANYDYIDNGFIKCPCCDYGKPTPRKIEYDNFKYEEGQVFVFDEDNFEVKKKFENNRWYDVYDNELYLNYHRFKIIKVSKNNIKFKNLTTGKNFMVNKEKLIYENVDLNELKDLKNKFSYIHNEFKYQFNALPHYDNMVDY